MPVQKQLIQCFTRTLPTLLSEVNGRPEIASLHAFCLSERVGVRTQKGCSLQKSVYGIGANGFSLRDFLCS